MKLLIEVHSIPQNGGTFLKLSRNELVNVCKDHSVWGHDVNYV